MGSFVLIAICSCVALAVFGAIAQGEEENNLKAKAITDAATAKRPDAYSRLFKEEFPEFANKITFVKSESMIAASSSCLASPYFKKQLHWLNKDQFKSEEAADLGMTELVNLTAQHVSPDFQAYALKNKRDAYLKFIGILNSSATLSRT